MFIMSVTRGGTSLNFNFDISRSIYTHAIKSAVLNNHIGLSLVSVENISKKNPYFGPLPVYQLGFEYAL